MRPEERTLITRYRTGPGGGSFRFLRCPPGRLIIRHRMRTERRQRFPGNRRRKESGETSIARCRSLILNSFASDFELAVFQPRRRLRRNDTGDSPRFSEKSVTAGVARATPRACGETRVSSRREIRELRELSASK